MKKRKAAGHGAKKAGGHRIGKRTRFEVRDGKYYVVEAYTESADRLGFERQSVQELLDAVNRFAEKRFSEILKRKQAWWDDILDDLGLEWSPHWKYDHPTRCLREEKPEPRKGAPGR